MDTMPKSVCRMSHRDWQRGWPTFPIKHKTTNILDFSDHVISVVTTQLYCCSKDVTINSKEMNAIANIPINFIHKTEGTTGGKNYTLQFVHPWCKASCYFVKCKYHSKVTSFTSFLLIISRVQNLW